MCVYLCVCLYVYLYVYICRQWVCQSRGYVGIRHHAQAQRYMGSARTVAQGVYRRACLYVSTWVVGISVKE